MREGLKEKLVETLIFPENSSLIVRIVLFPYSYFFINSLNWFISGIKEKNLFNLLTGVFYVLIAWGGLFMIFGLFIFGGIIIGILLLLGISIESRSEYIDNIMGFSFFVGLLMAFIVGRVRFKAYRIKVEGRVPKDYR